MHHERYCQWQQLLIVHLRNQCLLIELILEHWIIKRRFSIHSKYRSQLDSAARCHVTAFATTVKFYWYHFFLRRAGHNLWFSIWKTQLIFPQKQATNLEGLPKPSDPIQLNHLDYIVEGNRWTSVRRGLLFFIVRMTKFSKGLWRYEMLSGKVQRTFVCRSEVTLNSLNHHSSFFFSPVAAPALQATPEDGGCALSTCWVCVVLKNTGCIFHSTLREEGIQFYYTQ